MSSTSLFMKTFYGPSLLSAVSRGAVVSSVMKEWTFSTCKRPLGAAQEQRGSLNDHTRSAIRGID